jgi:hypothetical protein
MEKKNYTPILFGAFAVAAFLGFVACGIGYFSLHRQLAQMQAELRPSRGMGAMPFPMPVATPVTPAAPDSIEGQLRAEGKHWERTQGQIEPGSYVEDILAGRLNQPEGRGTIGKVVSTSADHQGNGTAQVDFGRGYSVPISKSELSAVSLTE